MQLPPPERPETDCCPRFDPTLWPDTEVTWTGKRFVKDRVRTFLHIPLNFDAVMKRIMGVIGAAGALATPYLLLVDERSWWGSDIYIAVTKDLPGETMETISGTLHTRVFEGPYSNIKLWDRKVRKELRARGKEVQKMLFFYTTCPKCAKAYGKNYVVLFALV